MARPGMNSAKYEVVSRDGEKVVLRDVGPWDRHPTITNDAEQVVEDVSAWAGGRRILYYDSDGELTELRHEGTKLTGFAFVKSEGKSGDNKECGHDV